MSKNTPKKDKTLLATAVMDELGERFCSEVERRYPRHTDKLAARDLGLSPATIIKIRQSRALPQNKGLLMAFAVYGPEFQESVLEPLTKAQTISRAHKLRAEINRIEAELAELEKTNEST